MIAAPRVLILSSALDAAPRAVALARPMTVAEVIEVEGVRLDLPTIAVLTDPAGNSRPVMRGEWALRQVTAGHQLAFVPVPGRGSLSSILSAVAGIALAIFAPWAAGAIVGMMGLQGAAATIATSVIAGGIMIAGQFIINRLMPQPGSVPAAEAVYSARASNNRAMPLEPIPALYGRLRYAPPYAARPYAEFVGNDQHLYQLHCLSIGDVEPLRWEIGETLVWTKEGGFQGAFAGGDTQIQIVRPGEAITLFPANVVAAATVDGQQVPDAPGWLGPFAVSAPGIAVSRIACDYLFPMGLIHIDKKGSGQPVSRTVTAEYRAIDAAGNPAGGWQTLFSVPHYAATRTPQRHSSAADVPAGRYEVRFGASGYDVSDGTGTTTTLNRVLWAGLRGYVEGFETPADCTLVATRVRATEHLSREAAGQYLWTCQRLLPTWSAGGGWTAPVATRSPAWAAADLLRRLDVADSDFDLSWLAAYAALWESRGDRFDAIFDRRWQASEALDAIVRVGRAYHVRLGWMIGFNRDEPKQVRRMAFTPDTVVRGSIRRKDIWFSEDSPDHLTVKYLDAEVWQEREVTAEIGAIGADKPQEMPTFGITGHDHAWREGIFTAAENAFRRSFRTFQTEREGRMLVRGDPVVLHDPLHDVVLLEEADGAGRWQDFARLDGRDGDVLTLDRAVPAEPGETYHVVLRDKRGREWGPCLVDGIDGAEITLDAADRLTVEAQHGQLAQVLPDTAREEPAHVSVLKGDYRLFDGLVVEARPVGAELWEVTLVNDDQRVHAVDKTEPVPAPWTPPAMIAPPPESPTVRGVYGLLQQGTLGLTLEAGWQPAAGAERYVAELSYDGDAASLPATASWTPVHDSRATRLSVTAMPQPLTLRVAGVGKVQGGWAYLSVVMVPELRLPDEVRDPILDEARDFAASMMDWADPESPIYPLGQGVAQNIADIHQIDEKVGLLQSELAELAGAADYDPLKTYAAGDIVKYGGKLYRARAATTGNVPTNPTYWEKVGDYASLGEAVVALNGRVEEAEAEIEVTQAGFRSTTRDSRRIYNALMSNAVAEIDKAGAVAFEARDRLDAAAIASRWTETEIARVDGVLTVHASDIALVQATLGTKADLTVTQALQATILDHGDLLDSQGASITAIQNALPGKADVSVTDSLQSQITSQGDAITSQGASITSIENVLPGKADQSALSALASTVTSQGNTIAAQGSAVTALESALVGYTGASAVATALSTLNTSVSNINGAMSAQATRADSLFAALGGSTNDVRLKYEAVAGPDGYSRLKAVGRTTGFADRAASFGFDVPNNAALPTRTWVQGDQFLILGADNQLRALFDASGAYIQNARIQGLTAANLAAGSITSDRLAAGTVYISSSLQFAPEVIAAGAISRDAIVNSGYTSISRTGTYDYLPYDPDAGGVGAWQNWLSLTINSPNLRPVLFFIGYDVYETSNAPVTGIPGYLIEMRVLLNGGIVTGLTSSASVSGYSALCRMASTFVAMPNTWQTSNTITVQGRAFTGYPYWPYPGLPKGTITLTAQCNKQ